MAKTIDKTKLDDLFDRLLNFEIYAPAQEDGVNLYRLLDNQLPDRFGNSKKPPKEIFFPQTEKMFDFEVEDSKVVDIKEPGISDNPILLFGIRPCDARAMMVLDELFTWDFVDPFYVERREKATTISLACTLPDMPRQSCFCTSVGGSPGSPEGADMLWTDIGHQYLVDSSTEKGNKIIDLGGNLFADAADAEIEQACQAREEASQAIVRTLDIDGLAEALDNGFDQKFWEGFSSRCLGCGICTLLCPTCHCFDINDVSKREGTWRERTWDSCQYAHYTAHASGHNPRPEKKHRQRNRICHKFLYAEKNLCRIGCVGCGRCISQCPVNIDIIEVAEGVKGAVNDA